MVRDHDLRRDISRYYWIIRSYDITNATAESYRSGLLQALLRNGIAPNRVDTDSLRRVLQDPEVRALIAQNGTTAEILQEVYGSIVMLAKRLLEKLDTELGA